MLIFNRFKIVFILFYFFLLNQITLSQYQPVVVDLTQQWVNTGIQVDVGDTVVIFAQGFGTWRDYSLNSRISYWFTPAGIGGDWVWTYNFPCPSCPGYSLLAKFGASGDPIFVGTVAEFKSDNSGTLYLGINDYLLEDNFGYFVALVYINPNIATLVNPSSPKGPSNFNLNQNYPNPFNPSTTIPYTLPSDGMVKLNIYDALGRKVCELVNEFQSIGEYLVNWDSRNDVGEVLSSGSYYYTLFLNETRLTKKMILLK